MPKDMLPPEVRAKFEQALQNDPKNQTEALPPDAQAAALNQGAQAAQAEIAATEGADAPPAAEQPPVPAAPEPAPDPNAAILAQYGFKSVQEMADAFATASQESAKANDTLRQMTAFQQAVGNENQLNPDDPNYPALKAVYDKFAPALEYLSTEARNRMVQKAWSESAKNMPDIGDLDADIGAFLKENPQLSIQEDGLARAYHAVRSSKYRPESQLLNDPEFVKKAASSDAVKSAVIEAYLTNIQRNGESVPPSINSGGGIPLTGAKAQPKTMAEANKALEQMLAEAERARKMR